MFILKSRIFRRFFIAATLILFAAFWLFTVLISDSAKESFKVTHLEILSSQGVRVRDHVYEWLDSHTRVVLTIAALMEESPLLDPAVSDENSGLLLALKEINTAFRGFTLIDPEGRIIMKSIGIRNDINLADRDYVRKSLNGEVAVTGFFRSRNQGGAIMTISAPVRKGRNAGYVLAGYISLEGFLDIFSFNNKEAMGRLLFVNESGQLISNPAYAAEFKTRTDIEADENYLLKTAAVESILMKKNGVGAYESPDGTKVYGAYYWLPELRIGMILESDRRILEKPLQRLLRTLLYVSIALYLGLLSLTLVSLTLVYRPIDSMIQGVENIIDHDYHEPITLRTGSRVDVLIDRFNEMADVLSKREAALKELASRDSLTGLYNNGTLKEFVGAEYEKRRRGSAKLCFIMADIDFFKNVNDSYGHLAGDMVLLSTARIILSCIRSGDLVGRYGGEEFGIIVNSGNPEVVMNLAERIRSAVEKHVFIWEGNVIPITVSLGWACIAAGDKVDRLAVVDQADIALYRAKNSGRNRVCGESA